MCSTYFLTDDEVHIYNAVQLLKTCDRDSYVKAVLAANTPAKRLEWMAHGWSQASRELIENVVNLEGCNEAIHWKFLCEFADRIDRPGKLVHVHVRDQFVELTKRHRNGFRRGESPPYTLIRQLIGSHSEELRTIDKVMDHYIER